MNTHPLLLTRSRRALVLAGVVATLLAALAQPIPAQAAMWIAV